MDKTDKITLLACLLASLALGIILTIYN